MKKLFDENYAALLLYSISIVKNKEDSEDIVQRAFLSLWRKMDSLKLHTSARAYLYKSVYHAGLDLLKHKKIRGKYENEWRRGVPIEGVPDGEENQWSEKVNSAIQGLPEQCRRIFMMSRYDRLRYKDIAAKLHISEKTVENQIVKAFKLLRERLAEHFPVILLVLLFCYDKG
ncbi:MAG TPA: RNA polymerase sigma-70 factor [Puia sp.]|nr:RNA polymerase sigma-70 factor [Puia sp.]